MRIDVVPDLLVSLGVVDLVACSLRACVNAQESHTLSELAENVPAALLDVWSGLLANDVARVFVVELGDEGLLELRRVRRSGLFVATGCLRRVCGKSADWWRQMVLEQHVVLVRNTSDTAEDGAAHEVVSVRAEAINNVMVIPDVQLRDLAVGVREGSHAVPLDVVVKVEHVALVAHVLAKGEVATLLGVSNGGPRRQRATDTHAVVVDLVAASDHDVEGRLLVHAEDVVPESRARPCLLVGAHGETVARVEHDAHALLLRGHEEACLPVQVLAILRAHAGDTVVPDRFLVKEGHLNGELPESALLVFVQLHALDLLRPSGLPSAAILQAELFRDVACRSHDKHTAVPDRVVRVLPAHVSVVQQGTADDFQSLARADNLWSVAHAIASGRDLVRGPGGHVGNRDGVAVGEKAIFCGYVVMRRLYGHARERHRGGVVGEEAITDRLRDARRVVLVYCRHRRGDV